MESLKASVEPVFFRQVFNLILIVSIVNFAQPYPVQKDVLQEHRAKKKSKAPKVRQTATTDTFSATTFLHAIMQAAKDIAPPVAEIPTTGNAPEVQSMATAQETQNVLFTKDLLEKVKLQNRLHLLLVKAFPSSGEIKEMTNQNYRQALQGMELPQPAPGYDYLLDIKADVVSVIVNSITFF